MRVLIPSLRSTSGIDAYAVALAAGLAAAGHKAVVVDERGDYESSDRRITRAALRHPRRLPGPLEPFAEWELQREVRRLAAEREVDGAHAVRPGLAPRGLPAAITVWDPLASPVGRYRAARGRGEHPGTETAYAVVDGFAARRAKAIVAVTEAVRHGYGRYGRCELIPPFLPDESVQEPIGVRGRDVVMVAGQLDLERKGLPLALAAMDRVNEARGGARLLLVGDWIDPGRRAALPEFCEATGRLSPSEVRSIFKTAGCCLIPSLWEEFGYAGLEALAARVPVACAPLPAYEGLGGGVFRAGSRDPADLAAQIEAALDAEPFEFPPQCRASVAIPRLLALYEEVF